jgi:hypothetical protein
LIQGFTLERKSDGAFGELAHVADGCLEADLFGLADLGRGRHTNHAIAFGEHLAGQHVALLGLVFAQRIFDVFLTEVVLARLGEAFAGTTGTVATIQRDVDALAIGSVGDGFAAIGVDKTSDAIFEVQSNLVSHGGSPQRWYTSIIWRM